MASAPTDISRSLQAFAAGFHEQGKQLSELQTTSPTAFQHVILSLLLEARDTPRFRFLIAYLSSRGLLPKCVKALRGVDRGLAALVVELAERMLPDGALPSDGGPREGAELDPAYLMGLLEAFSTGLNMLTIHAGALEGLDGKLRARLATILGKAARTQETFAALVQDSDSRVRANAVESLWGSASRMAREVFQQACGDGHHRVAGNAWVGLYLQGDPASVGGMAGMIRHRSAAWRAAAAWAMGRVGDARFVSLLQATRREPGQDPAVVRNCLAAVKRVHHTASAASQEAVLRILDVQPAPPGRVTLAASVRARGGAAMPRLEGTAFRLSCGGEPVWEYTCECVTSAPAVAMAFLLPVGTDGMRVRGRSYRAALDDAFLRCRAEDRIGMALYSELPIASPNPLFGASPLARDPADIHETLGDIPGPANVAQGPFGPMEELVEKMRTFEGDRHLIWVVDQLAGSFLEKAHAPALGGVKLHAVCSARAPAAASRVAAMMTRATGGVFAQLGAEDDLALVCEDLVASFSVHYRLSCPLPKEAGRWGLEVVSGEYAGKTER